MTLGPTFHASNGYVEAAAATFSTLSSQCAQMLLMITGMHMHMCTVANMLDHLNQLIKVHPVLSRYVNVAGDCGCCLCGNCNTEEQQSRTTIKSVLGPNMSTDELWSKHDFVQMQIVSLLQDHVASWCQATD